MKKILTLSLLASMLLITSCSDKQPSKTKTPTPIPDTPVITCPLCANLPTKPSIVHNPLPEHAPTTFDSSTINMTELEIAKGVVTKTYTFTKNNGKKSEVVVTEIDLTKANIAAGTKDNSLSSLAKATPYNQLLAYEQANPNHKVVAAINADFFGGTSSVNAFVKDSVIIKDSHNDNGIYDYTNLSADLPASMPMLFGISGTTAQIAPIIQNATVEETIKSKLYYEITITKENTSSSINENIIFNNEEGSSTNLNVITSFTSYGTALEGSKVITIEKHKSDSTRVHGKVTDISEILGNSLYSANEDYFYIIVPKNMTNTFEINDVISYNVTSKDETWKYFDTILGCRQALIIDGNIASTVSKENSNGAQTSNIPRTAIGIMPDGKVALFSVESLRYGKKSSSENDPYGLSLPELADFMRYYGVYSGANFDGGGSTQLITLNPTTKELEVKVRSSDYGTFELNNSRAVINTLLVYVKEE